MTRAVWMVFGMAAVAGCDRAYTACYGGQYEELPATVDASDGELVFDWELGTAYALSVYELDADGEIGEEMWHLQCGGDALENDHTYEEQVCIRTPIAYGEAVDSEHLDTVSSTPAEELVPGEMYQLTLSTLTEDDGTAPPPEHPGIAKLFDWLPERDDDPHCGALFGSEVDFVAP